MDDAAVQIDGVNLAAVYILNNEQDKADQVLIKSFGEVEVPDMILVQVYSRVKNYKRLAGIWRALVKKSPNNLEFRKNLSGAQLLANQKIAAIRTLEEAIKDFPEFKEEGEKLIKEINWNKYIFI